MTQNPNTSGSLLVALLVVGVLGSGCAGRYENSVFVRHNSVMAKQQILSLNHDRVHSYTPALVKDVLGAPERYLTVAEFVSLLNREHLHESTSFRPNLDLRLTRYIEDTGRHSGETASGPPEVDRCEVWLYRWASPTTVKLSSVGGLPLFAAGESNVHCFSYAYVFYDFRLIDWVLIERTPTLRGG